MSKEEIYDIIHVMQICKPSFAKEAARRINEMIEEKAACFLTAIDSLMSEIESNGVSGAKDTLDRLFTIRAFYLGAETMPRAAANKAAEEGGLPTPRAIMDVVDEFGSGTSCYTVDDMRHAIAADRASRQVANKAEVEPECAECNGHGCTHYPDGEWQGKCSACKCTGIATPPATTGASTVLTDERLSMEKILEIAGQHLVDDFHSQDALDFARAIEREVAAQAGQVAGWMNPANGEVTSAANKKQMESADFGQWKEIATRYTVPLLAPSPAKESK